MPFPPLHAKDLLAAPLRHDDQFFLIAQYVYDPASGKHQIAISGDIPIAVKDKKLRQELGVNLPTRQEVNQGATTIPNAITLGAGCFVELILDDGQSYMPLFQRSLTAPTNPGKWTNPSGLCSSAPHETAAMELGEELSLVIRNDKEKTLTLLVPLLEQSNAQLMKTKEQQIPELRQQLGDKYKDYAIALKPWQLQVMPLKQEAVLIRLHGDEQGKIVPMLPAYDEKNHALTLSYHIKGSLPGVTMDQLMMFDLEKLGRTTALLTAQSLHSGAYEFTPALDKAVKQKLIMPLNQQEAKTWAEKERTKQEAPRHGLQGPS